MKKILITGAAGFLGYHSAEYFYHKGYEVFGIDCKDLSKELVKNIFHKFIRKNVTTKSLNEFDNRFDVILHCAGGSSVGYSLQFPEDDFKRTVMTTVDVLDYIRNYNNNAILIYPSSAAVYGIKKDMPVSIKSSLRPITPYGLNKMFVEKLCKLYNENYGLKIGIVRFFSLYGEGLKKQILWDACNKLISGKENAIFFGTGSEIRDFIHVKDAAALIYKISKSLKGFQVYNGGTGIGTNVAEMINLIKKESDSNVNIIFNNKKKPGDPLKYIANISETLEIGWKPAKKLFLGVKEYIGWYKNLKCNYD